MRESKKIRRRDETAVQSRFLPDELEAIDAAAERLGWSRGQFMRRAALVVAANTKGITDDDLFSKQR